MSIPILRGARLLFRVDPLPRETYAALPMHAVIAAPFLWSKLPDYRRPGWNETTASSRLPTCYAWSPRSGRLCTIGISVDAIDSTNGHFLANGLATTI